MKYKTYNSLPDNLSHSYLHSIIFWKNFKQKNLLLLKLILLNKWDLTFSHTYFCDHLVQTVFQSDGHIPTFYWGYKEHLQHREHLQIWLAVKDTLNIRYQVKNVILKDLWTWNMKNKFKLLSSYFQYNMNNQKKIHFYYENKCPLWFKRVNLKIKRTEKNMQLYF